MPTIKDSDNIFLRMHPLHRVLISVVLTVLTFFLIRKNVFDSSIILLILWDVFSCSYLITCWIVIFTRSVLQIREQAKKQDGSRFFVFAIIILSSFASMVTVLLLIISRDKALVPEAIYLPATITGMLFSWIMVHTTFCFHYAHLYYGDDTADPKKHLEGLEFPKEKKPDYLDFAYFSFVVGMTFQVSDVEVSSREIRRVVLVHGLISFLLNTFVVALTINLIAGLKD